MNETITIVRKHIRQDDSIIEVYTCFDDEYRLWPDRTPGSNKWRWALDAWPDDGLGIPTHGAGASMEDVARACAENRRLRQSVSTT